MAKWYFVFWRIRPYRLILWPTSYGNINSWWRKRTATAFIAATAAAAVDTVLAGRLMLDERMDGWMYEWMKFFEWDI